MNIKQILKILSINSFVLGIFIIGLEVFHRVIAFSIKCAYECDYSLFTFKPYTLQFTIGISEKDKDLGYVPKSNFSSPINIMGWNKNSRLTIDNLGLRKTIHANKGAESILTVGDSFTFGDQVDDSQTWQTCLNKIQNTKNFLNAGVYGYGTAQAIIRAKKLYPIVKPSSLLVSTLVGSNFIRDQLEIRDGFPKPYISKNKNNLTRVVSPQFNIPNTRFSNKKDVNFEDYIYSNFTFFRRFPNNSYLKNRYLISHKKITSSITKKGSNVASKKEIIQWSIKESKMLDSNVIWLLQYNSKILPQDIQERKLLRKLLNQSNINLIDTFDSLHGKHSSNLIKNEIWNGHHTYLGNLLVCQEIAPKYFK